MKGLSHLILTVLVFFLAVVSSLAQITELRTEIDKIIKYDTELDIEDNPGFIISIIDQDSTYHLSYGNTYSDSPSSPTSNDIYEVGSVTKSFTAILTLALEERGYLNIKDPVNNHLHPNHQNPRLDNITIRDLLVHTSGLPKHPDLFGRKMKDPQNPYENYDKGDLLSYYSGYVSDEEPIFEYSHTNYALLEIILENATGSDLQQLMRKYIWNPMKMDNTFVTWNKESEMDISPGYDKASRITEPWIYKSFMASEGVKSTAQDMCSYINFQVNEDIQGSLSNVIAKAQEIQVPNSLNESISSAYGWQVFSRDKDGYPIFTYTGRTSGHNAFIAYVKETKTAVIILSNSVLGTEDLGLQVLRMINYNWKRKV